MQLETLQGILNNFAYNQTPDPTGGAGLGGAGALISGSAQALGTAFQIGGALFGDNDPGQYHLNPTHEVQYLNMLQDQFTQANQLYQQYSQGVQIYQQQISMLDQYFGGQLNQAQLQQGIQSQGVQLARLAGGSPTQAIKMGLLDENTARVADLIESQAGQLQDKLSTLEQQNIIDPVTEENLKNQRNQLAQNILRNGGSADQLQRALAEFDTNANLIRFQAGQELKNQQFNRLTQGYQTQVAGLNTALQSRLAGQQFGLQALGVRAGLAQSGLQALASQSNALQALGGFQRQGFELAGQTDFTKAGRAYLESGVAGPGTLAQQTGGISGDYAQYYRDLVKEQENQVFRRQNFAPTQPGKTLQPSNPSSPGTRFYA